MYYISAASTISHQPAFRNAGFSGVIEPLHAGSALINPDYKEYIEPGLLRRMSKILRMSVACSGDCLKQGGIEQPDAIVVGTGLGCLLDTEKFLNNALTVKGLLPPTSFIQSTHNTMAGQISLSLGNHGYNMTHTQNSISFENALLDAMLLIDEGEKHILVGAADEHIALLDEISAQLNIQSDCGLTSGASFFILSAEKSDQTLAGIKDAEALGLVKNIPEQITAFLDRNNVNPDDLDLILYAGSVAGTEDGEKDFQSLLKMKNLPVLDYMKYSGIYPTASAFALHMAADQMQHTRSIKNILICNSLIQHNLGLILVQSVEA
ncbi:beta-ketoacyl synthase chain length factor [Dyadobacter sediminis]|uniref:beta-ketoacyl synthase chain length factor n=1 Tax=Dyadobacter sediminis TaxID=1493691 RepID=UPI0019B0E4D5|nr:beta-ketoacyl synthase chain length factor [Dyadobacter sediminis]GGB85470.1 3-oxoacyl-ACP synthase [Dyadobacter sediminis]